MALRSGDMGAEGERAGIMMSRSRGVRGRTKIWREVLRWSFGVSIFEEIPVRDLVGVREEREKGRSSGEEGARPSAQGLLTGDEGGESDAEC